tara:strand:+ start:757 stop:1092 length:336 start_codon:yes stop_codon:yes gene_type:complete
MINEKTCVPCQGGIPPLDDKEINLFLTKLNLGWEVIQSKEIRKEYIFKNYKEAILFVNNVADLAEEEGHHPYIHINYKNVCVILFTHKINGLHENDFILASKCDIIFDKLI